VAFNYIWTEYKKRASIEEIESRKGITPPKEKMEKQDLINFKIEVERLTNILNGYNIDSRIYSIYTRNGDLDHKEIRDFLYQNELFEILDPIYIQFEGGGDNL